MLLIKKKNDIFGLLIRFHSSELETTYLVVHIFLVFNSFQTVSLFEFYFSSVSKHFITYI